MTTVIPLAGRIVVNEKAGCRLRGAAALPGEDA
jgi:hypothetical protein